MCNLASRGPKCDDVCTRFDRRNKPLRQWWDREPGYVREENARMARRRTDTQFLREHCHHQGVRDRRFHSCMGVCIGPDPLQGKRELAMVAAVARKLQEAGKHETL